MNTETIDRQRSVLSLGERIQVRAVRISLVAVFAFALLLAGGTPAPAQVRVKDKPKTNDVSVGSATNYILVEITALGTNSTQLISIGNLISNTIPALLNLAGSTATNNAITNATSFGVFDQIAMGVFRYYNLEQGTNVILYRTPTSIVINATAPAGSGGGGPGSLAADTTQLRTNTILQIIAGASVTNLSALNLTNRGAFTNIGAAGFGDNLYVFGNTDLEGHLDVNGIGTFASVQVGAILTVNGALSSFAQDLTVGGPFTASGGVKIGNGQPIQALAILDANTNVVGWINTNVIGNLSGATNGLTTRVNNLDGSTNALNTRVNNLDGATNGLTTRVNNLDGSTNALDALVRTKQHGTAALTNLNGTVGRNVTNVVSLSTSNATSKPLTNAYSSGVLTLFGLEAGANVTITPNGSNLVVASTGGGGGGAYKTNDVAVGTQNTANYTNNTDILWILTEQGGAARIDIEARIQDDAVDFAQMQNISTDRLIGRDTAGTGNPEEISLDGTTLEWTGSASIRRAALTGDITASAGSATTDLANNAVEDTELRDSAGVSLIGRAANSTGDPADIPLLNNGEWLWRSNNAVISGKGVFTNTMFMNVNFLSAAGGSVIQFHDNTGIITNKPITLTDTDSVTGVLPLANSTTNYTVITAETAQFGNSTITNWHRLIGYSHFLRGTNLWADGGAGSLYSNTLFGISGGVSNLLWTNIQDGQDIVSWLFVSNGVSVGFPQFVASDFPDGAVVTPNTNCWTKVIVSRRNTTTNIQVFTATYTLEDGFNIVGSTNHAARTITKSLKYAPDITNANLVGTTQADIITNAASLHFRVETRLIPTNNSLSNIVVNFAQTNAVELWATNNLTFTNWSGLAAGVESRKTILIRPQLIPRGVNWGQGIGYSVRVLTNANSPLWTTLTNDKTYAASFVVIGTNIFPTVTLWE